LWDKEQVFLYSSNQIVSCAITQWQPRLWVWMWDGNFRGEVDNAQTSQGADGT
jgi:hypothetical protein